MELVRSFNFWEESESETCFLKQYWIPLDLFVIPHNCPRSQLGPAPQALGRMAPMRPIRSMVLGVDLIAMTFRLGRMSDKCRWSDVVQPSPWDLSGVPAPLRLPLYTLTSDHRSKDNWAIL